MLECSFGGAGNSGNDFSGLGNPELSDFSELLEEELLLTDSALGTDERSELIFRGSGDFSSTEVRDLSSATFSVEVFLPLVGVLGDMRCWAAILLSSSSLSSSEDVDSCFGRLSVFFVGKLPVCKASLNFT